MVCGWFTFGPKSNSYLEKKSNLERMQVTGKTNLMSDTLRDLNLFDAVLVCETFEQ